MGDGFKSMGLTATRVPPQVGELRSVGCEVWRGTKARVSVSLRASWDGFPNSRLRVCLFFMSLGARCSCPARLP